MPNPDPAHYQDARGVHHDVVVRKTPGGGWQVVDISVAKTTVVETLTAVDDGRPEAEAIAREYARENAAVTTGQQPAAARNAKSGRRPSAASPSRQLNQFDWARAPLPGAPGPRWLTPLSTTSPTKEVSS